MRLNRLSNFYLRLRGKVLGWMTGFESNWATVFLRLLLITGLVSLKFLIRKRLGLFYLLRFFLSLSISLTLFEHNFGHRDSFRV